MSRCFEVFVGEGLGLTDSSLEQRAELGKHPNYGQAGIACYVNAANGNFYYQEGSESIAAQGRDWQFASQYNSQNGWQFTQNQSISKDKDGTFSLHHSAH